MWPQFGKSRWLLITKWVGELGSGSFIIIFIGSYCIDSSSPERAHFGDIGKVSRYHGCWMKGDIELGGSRFNYFLSCCVNIFSVPGFLGTAAYSRILKSH